MERSRRPTHPGIILRSLWLTPSSISQENFAKVCGLSRKHLNEIILGKKRVTTETAVRFAGVLNTTPAYWLNLQQAVDLYDIKEKLSKEGVELKSLPVSPISATEFGPDAFKT